MGRSDLRHAVKDLGGTPYWAEQLGLPLGPGQDRNVDYGVEDSIRDARSLIAQLGSLPNTSAIRKAGYSRLSTFIEKRGGVRRFLAEHGDEL